MYAQFFLLGFHKQRDASQRCCLVHGQAKLLLGQALPASAASVPAEALPKEVPSDRAKQS